MLQKTIKFIFFLFSFISLSFSQNWETIGGTSGRTSFCNVIGPDRPEILWEGSIYSKLGLPILISDNKLVTTRETTWENAPLVCHNITTGDTIWTLDFGGVNDGASIPIGFKNNVVYATNWFGLFHDTLYALNADNGNIIWRSTVGVVGNYYQGIAFTKNGDIIISALEDHIIRIDHLTGDTLWCIKRYIPVIANYCGIAVYNTTAYAWNMTINEPLRIIAIDVNTGNIKYGKEVPSANPSGLMTAPLPVVDKNGIIYALKAEDNLVAIKDNNDSMTILWNIPIKGGGETKPAIGPDGSVYFTNHKRVMRASSENGDIIDSSVIIYSDSVLDINGHFAIDAVGKVYFNNGIEELYLFTKDLKLKWADTIETMYFGGPSLGPNGILVVTGKNNILRVYKTDSTFNKKNVSYKIKPKVSHTFFPGYITFKYYIQNYTNVELLIYTIKGQSIYILENMPSSPGYHSVNIKEIHENFGCGQFIYKIIIGENSILKKLTIIK